MMTGSSQSLLKLFVQRLNKYRFPNNATLENITGRMQEKFAGVQSVANKIYNDVKQGTTVQSSNNVSLQSSTAVSQKVIKWWQLYQQLTGLNNVEYSKQQVNLLQNKLFKYQEDRRKVHEQAILINDRLKEIYAELIQTKRDDPKYVQLTIMENKGLQEQGRINGHIALLENVERDCFTQLTTAIKEYHDSQTMNAQKYKYLSIFASAITAIISLIFSMIYNNKRVMNIKNTIVTKQEENKSAITTSFQLLQNQINSKFSELSEKLSTNQEQVYRNDPVNGTKQFAWNISVENTIKIGTGIIISYILLRALS